MPTKTKLLVVLLLLTLAGTGRASFYIDLRVSHLLLDETPEIGDIGVKTGSDLPALSPSLALGYELSKRASLELRYTHVGDITISKVSPYATVFPLKPGEFAATVMSDYDFDQRTDLFTAALPFRVWEQGQASLQITPMIQFEASKVELSFVGLFPPLPNVNTVPIGAVFYRRSTTELHAGAEIALGYRLSERARAYLHYTYAPLSNFDAHLIGTEFEFKF